MAPLLIPPVVAGALGALGVVALAKLVAKEWRRVNAELYPPKGAADRDEAKKLTRDPQTGVYRPE